MKNSATLDSTPEKSSRSNESTTEPRDSFNWNNLDLNLSYHNFDWFKPFKVLQLVNDELVEIQQIQEGTIFLIEQDGQYFWPSIFKLEEKK